MKSVLKTALLLLLFSTVIKSSVAAPIKVFAAASLTEAFKVIGTAYATLHPDSPVSYSFAGSPTLRTQIQEGAPADVFASADHPNMDGLAAQHLVGAQRVFAENVMVVVVPADSQRIAKLGDLANAGVHVILAGPKVPAGRYAEEVLAKMTPGIQVNFAASVLGNVVSRETDVKAVLAKVELGEADAGFVFATDAVAAGKKVRTIPIPAEYNVVGEYPIAPVTGTADPADAESFIEFVLSPAGQSILRAHGFLSPPAEKP